MGRHRAQVADRVGAQEFGQRALRHGGRGTKDPARRDARGARHRRQAAADGRGETRHRRRPADDVLRRVSPGRQPARRARRPAADARQPSTRGAFLLQQLGLQRPRHDLRAADRRRHLRLLQAPHRRSHRPGRFRRQRLRLGSGQNLRPSQLRLHHECARPRAVRHAVCARRSMGRPPDRAGAMGRRQHAHACRRAGTAFPGQGYGHMWWTRFRRRLRTGHDRARDHVLCVRSRRAIYLRAARTRPGDRPYRRHDARDVA